MTFNGLTDNQAEGLRKQYGDNRSREETHPLTAAKRFSERFGRIPIKIYIIVLLCCLGFGIVFSFGGGLWGVLSCVTGIVAETAAVAACCLWEGSLHKRSHKKGRRSGSPNCKVYRCGNSVSEISSDDIVKGDYVLLTAGDIAPAEGIVQTGDITVERSGKTDLIRRHREEELDEDISGEYTLERGTLVTSGHAVIKITEIGGGYAKRPSAFSKGYAVCIAVGIAFAAALTFYAAYSAEKSGEGMMSLPITAAFYSSLILIAGAGIPDPLGFYLSAGRPEIRRSGADIKKLTPKSDLLFIDKRCFITDGKPTVTGFTDGNGASFRRFYEIPYPLGTIAAKAAAENTSALVNKGRIISADPYEYAEMTFMAERLKSTVDLEITAELVKGTLSAENYKRFLRGDPAEIIGSCKNCFDGAGKEKEFSSAAALRALAEELIFQGNTVIAYAVEFWDGRKTFIGMITVCEKVRKGADNAFRLLSSHGKRAVLLVPNEEAALPDMVLTSAGADDVIPFSRLSSMERGELLGALKRVRIITGKCDKEQLISLAKAAGRSVGITAVDVRDVLSCGEADTVYAAYESCGAAKEFADSVAYSGAQSIAASIECSAEVRKAAAGYEAVRAAMLLLAAAAMLFGAEFGAAAYIGAALLGIVITGLAAFLLGRLCKSRCEGCGISTGEVR